MGAIAKKIPEGERSALSEREDRWQREATLAAIESCRKVVGSDGINARSMISSLGEVEWGWIVSAAIFSWIKVKARQAVEEGSGYDVPIRSMVYQGAEPWQHGAIESILPALGNLEAVPWGKVIGDWSKDEINSFAYQIHRLVDSAYAARDQGSTDKIAIIKHQQNERETSAANKGPLMSRDEMNDDIPF